MGRLVQFENNGLNVVLAISEQLRRQNLCFPDGFATPLGDWLKMG